jgi:hypothetical protein
MKLYLITQECYKYNKKFLIYSILNLKKKANLKKENGKEFFIILFFFFLLLYTESNFNNGNIFIVLIMFWVNKNSYTYIYFVNKYILWLIINCFVNTAIIMMYYEFYHQFYKSGIMVTVHLFLLCYNWNHMNAVLITIYKINYKYFWLYL